MRSRCTSPSGFVEVGRRRGYYQAVDGREDALVLKLVVAGKIRRMSQAIDEVARRRTFAIISHPDAGKTTLTEKLLLFGGAIQLAGTVKGRKATRHATSDWMRLEQQRGISVTSSVMQFPYEGRMVNLLDTPGHEDFSEDTYRTLTAVDSALMVIDCAKGVEERTIKLMEVCRLRDTPIMTFINKLDREGASRTALLDEIERVLRIQCAPGDLADRHGSRAARHLSPARGPHLRLPGGASAAGRARTRSSTGSRAPRPTEFLGDSAAAYRDEIELVRGASHAFDLEQYRAGRQTPVFFGSAINNFGVTELLAAFVEYAPGAARPRDDRRARSSRTKTRCRASCSRSRRTWIRGTATASPSCGSAPGAIARACGCSTCATARKCASATR